MVSVTGEEDRYLPTAVVTWWQNWQMHLPAKQVPFRECGIETHSRRMCPWQRGLLPWSATPLFAGSNPAGHLSKSGLLYVIRISVFFDPFFDVYVLMFT